MRNKQTPMNLSPEEASFLRHWIYDEAHYQQGPGLAKRLQVEHRVRPADLAVLIAASLPNSAEQEAAAALTPSEAPRWPWSAEALASRLQQARVALGLAPTEKADAVAT